MNNTPILPRKVIIDTDPGVGVPGTDADDPIALLLALATPQLHVLGVTTIFGNCPPQLGARGALAVLQAAGRTDVPVYVGAPTPLSGHLPSMLVEAYRGQRGREGRLSLPPLPVPTQADSHAHGDDAVAFITEQAQLYPGQVTLITIGPQTNLARALALRPQLAEELVGVVAMAGAFGIDAQYGGGNITAYAECNVWYDAPAAAAVLASGLAVDYVGLDVTNPARGVMLTEQDIASLDPLASSAEKLLADICSTYLAAPMFDLAHGCVLYDPLAVAAAAHPTLGHWQPAHVCIDATEGPQQGRTQITDGPANARVMTDVDGRSAVQDMIATIRKGLG